MKKGALKRLTMQAQWAEAVTHENEKLHQLTDMQKAIIHDLQGGVSVASPVVSQAQDLSEKALSAKGVSQEACQLRASLLSHTGHARVRPDGARWITDERLLLVACISMCAPQLLFLLSVELKGWKQEHTVSRMYHLCRHWSITWQT